MQLFIDTSTNTQLTLHVGEKQKIIRYASPRSQDVLSALQDFLDELTLSLDDLSSIEVVQGPGTFTSLRTGIAIAQTLSFALGIPINSLPAGTSIEAQYGKAPSISSPKKDLETRRK